MFARVTRPKKGTSVKRRAAPRLSLPSLRVGYVQTSIYNVINVVKRRAAPTLSLPSLRFGYVQTSIYNVINVVWDL